jgi:hypothetical protein
LGPDSIHVPKVGREAERAQGLSVDPASSRRGALPGR